MSEENLNKDVEVLEQDYVRKPQTTGIEMEEWTWYCTPTGGCYGVAPPADWNITNTNLDVTPFYLDPYLCIKHSFYSGDWYFSIYLSRNDETQETDVCWAYSLDGRSYTKGGVIYANYGSANEIQIWYDSTNKKVYLYRIDWDAGGHCVQIGTVGGNDISWGSKKNISTTYRSCTGICKTSNGRLWIVYARNTNPYNVYCAYSDNDGDTWSGLDTEVSTNGKGIYMFESIVPLTSSTVYILYGTSSPANHLWGRTWDGSSFGSEQNTHLGFMYGPCQAVVDSAGRVHEVNYYNTEITHNYRSASGDWQDSPSTIVTGLEGNMGNQLIMNTANNKVLCVFVDAEDSPIYRAILKYAEWDGTEWGDIATLGYMEDDPEAGEEYAWQSLRTPYAYDGYLAHLSILWQNFDPVSNWRYLQWSGIYN